MEFNNINKFKGYLIPEQKLGLLVSYIVMAIIITVVTIIKYPKDGYIMACASVSIVVKTYPSIDPIVAPPI